MHLAVAAVLVVTGVINGLPVVGILGAGPLARLYGVPITDPDLLVLMRHRAVLLGLLGCALVAAAFVPAWRLPAAVAGLVSMAAFVALAAASTSTGARITTTVVVDIVLSVALAVAVALEVLAPSA